MTKLVVDAQLPCHMVGSYPRPEWFPYQLEGRDLLQAFKVESARQAYEDATLAIIREQEEAGLDAVSDGQMHYDDYGGAIGSFVWYWYERIPGFVTSKLQNPGAMGASEDNSWSDVEIEMMDNWGGTQVLDAVGEPKSRLVEMFRIAQRRATKPVKVSVGAGPVNLGFHVDFNAPGSAYANQRELAEALAPIFNAELKALVAAGCQYIQLEDLGAWLFADKDADTQWLIDVYNETVEGVDAKLGWHSCLGAAYGNTLRGFEGLQSAIMDPMYQVNVDQYVLDFALRDMQDIDALSGLPKGKEVAVGVVDIRSLYVESDAEIAGRMRRVLEVVPAEQVWFTTDCGMKALPRFIANQKLKALVRARDIVRDEL